MKKIAIIIGSESDLKQCRSGLEWLSDHKNLAEVVGVYISSQHRNTGLTQQLLRNLVNSDVDVTITGAGWANHLSGCCDAWLRYTMRTTKMPIIGVAFEDPKNERHTQAAILSITEVPGTQVIYKNYAGEKFIGSPGFLAACIMAVEQPLPVINLPEPKRSRDLSLAEALIIAQQ